MAAHIHRTGRSPWLRAAVLGANDGILSISSLLLGVATAITNTDAILIAGCAGLVGGALSMGAGEYVSVSSQADAERADLEIERHSLHHDYDAERAELRDIYVKRGLDFELATQVSRQLMERDALGAHARDEIGITEALSARPLQAALTSAASFVCGGIFPLATAHWTSVDTRIPAIFCISLMLLATLGALSARVGGAPIIRGLLRVLIGGGLVMAATSTVGMAFGVFAQ
jgi:VIT1/CCC1 family predicted Fe2+/Mn2+ transporter